MENPAPTPVAATDFSPAVLEQLQRLQQRYHADDQDLASYLEGYYHTRYLGYWDYIQLETLLSLQRPRTEIPDERIFIIYHQITELYFKLCLCEYEQLGELQQPTAAEVTLRVGRINRYFENLIDSFDVMVDGMDKHQFLQFRLALMPASGFQSAQYRMIELASTALSNLVPEERRRLLGEAAAHDELLGCIYWKSGATVVETGAKALTLTEFEKKYTAQLNDFAHQYVQRNLWAVVQRLPEGPEGRQHPRLLRQLRQLDVNVNVNWPLMHYKSAVRYLERNPDSIAATGGTNWQQYLPPKFQRRIFYPQLWTETELADWGKAWVESVLGGE